MKRGYVGKHPKIKNNPRSNHSYAPPSKKEKGKSLEIYFESQ